MATYWENSCSFGLRYVSWYKYLIVSLVFSHLGFWSGNLFLIAPFPDLCLLVPFYIVIQKPEYQWMTLSTRLGVAEINTLCHFRYPQLVKMPTNIVSFPRLSGTGITSLNHCFPLLKCQMIVCPNSNLL